MDCFVASLLAMTVEAEGANGKRSDSIMTGCSELEQPARKVESGDAGQL